jgi:thioredoxin-related protein
MDRRRMLAWSLAGIGLGGLGRRTRAEAVLGEDGLYHQPWFLDSFLILGEDLEEAHARGKRLAIMWELKGCPYCKETHLVNFARPDIEAYVRDNFEVLQLNLLGSRMVTDFDGEELEERRMAEKHAIRFTPTFQFFPETTAEISGTGRAAEVARMPGYFKPDHFLAMFRFVREKAYERQPFKEFLQTAGAG